MSHPPKVHVFLGAPPPPSCPALEAGVEAKQRPPADWRRLELRWMEGQLRPETGEAFRDQNPTNLNAMFELIFRNELILIHQKSD